MITQYVCGERPGKRYRINFRSKSSLFLSFRIGFTSDETIGRCDTKTETSAKLKTKTRARQP